jgi:hypothetical protein
LEITSASPILGAEATPWSGEKPALTPTSLGLPAAGRREAAIDDNHLAERQHGTRQGPWRKHNVVVIMRFCETNSALNLENSELWHVNALSCRSQGRRANNLYQYAPDT